MNLTDQTLRLERFIDKHLPQLTAMGVAIDSYDGTTLQLTAPLQLNHNDKMTGFGGSIYTLCLSNAIGLLFIKCFEAELNPNLVVKKAEIQYLQPAAADPLLSTCAAPSDSNWQDFFDYYREHGKSSITLQASLITPAGTAALFTGRFTIIGESDTTIF